MSDEAKGHETHCPVDGCPGDYRYAPPGRGHTCTTETWLTAQALAGAAADDEAVEALAHVLRDLPTDARRYARLVLAAGYLPPERCICNTSPSTEGPDETCPLHGRSVADWIERGDILQERLAHVEQQAREREAAAWNRGWEDAGQWRAAENIASARRLPMPPVPENPYRADRGGDRG